MKSNFILVNLRENRIFKKVQKTLIYSRTRRYFPLPDMDYVDDHEHLPEAEKVLIDWPIHLKKPTVGLIKDYDPYPRWTKLCRFLENNSFSYDFFDIHALDWIEKAEKFDIFVGVLSNEHYHLDELRRKYFVLEKYLGKKCFPSFEHIFIYENKTLEAHISKAAGIPFAQTKIFNRKKDALDSLDLLHYPLVSKIDPGSGSIGVELIRNQKQARHMIERVFSPRGRATHSLYFRQKNYVYFQDYIPNDGYDIRVILVNNWAFGYYRKVPKGDFRASGMGIVEKRELPQEAVRIAWMSNKIIKSPLLVVDMVHGLDDRYYVIEFSPICQIELPEQLHVNGIPGVYIIDDDGTIHFQQGKYWVHELALREFLLHDYLPIHLNRDQPDVDQSK